MTWTNAVHLIVKYLPTSKKFVYKLITKALVTEKSLLLLDGPQLLHKLFPSLAVLSTLDAPAAAFALKSRVLLYLKNVLKGLPENGHVVLVCDGLWLNRFKEGEKNRRELAIKRDDKKIKTLISKLFKLHFDTPEFEAQRLVVEKEIKTVGSLNSIRAETLYLVLAQLQSLKEKRISVVIATGEAEATISKLAREIPSALAVTTDADAFSFNAPMYARTLKITKGVISGTLIDVTRALTSSTFTSKCAPAKGVLASFGKYALLVANFVHGMTGSDFSSIGGGPNSRGISGAQNATALKIFEPHASFISSLSTNQEAFNYCMQLILESSVWKNATEKMSETTKTDKIKEFEDGVLYFFLGAAVNVTSPNPAVSLGDALRNHTLLVTQSHVNHDIRDPLSDDQNRQCYLHAPSNYNESDFFGENLKNTQPYKDTTNPKIYFPYCGFANLNEEQQKLFYYLADTQVLRSLLRTLGQAAPAKISRGPLAELIKNRLRIGAKPENNQDNGSTYERVNLPHSQQVAGPNTTQHVITWLQNALFARAPGGMLPMHPFFARCGLSEGKDNKATSATEVLRAMKLVLGGHFALENMKIFLGEHDTYGRVVCFEFGRVLASYKAQHYITQVSFSYPPDGVEFNEPIYLEDLSMCSCVAGIGACSHKSASSLFVALVSTLVGDTMEDEDVKEVITRISDLLPADALLAQGTVTRLDQHFSREISTVAADNTSYVESSGTSSSEEGDSEEDGENSEIEEDANDESSDDELSAGALDEVRSDCELDEATFSIDYYQGDLLDRLIRIVRDDEEILGFGKVVHAKDFAARKDTAQIEEITNIRRGATAMFGLMVAGNINKKMRGDE